MDSDIVAVVLRFNEANTDPQDARVVQHIEPAMVFTRSKGDCVGLVCSGRLESYCKIHWKHESKLLQEQEGLNKQCYMLQGKTKVSQRNVAMDGFCFETQ